MSRSDARACGFLLTFEYLFNKNVDENLIFEENKVENDEERDFSLGIFSCIKDNFNALEQKIEDNLKNNMKIKDLCVVDKAILLASIAQIDFMNEPMGLVINEAVRIAKKYSTDKSHAFVNGVLASIYSGR